MRLLVIDPLEPLALPKTQISGPQLGGPHPSIVSAPQPTTVLGLLGRAMNILIQSGLDTTNLEDVSNLIDELSERLLCKKDEPIMYGPFLARGGSSGYIEELYVPLDPNTYIGISTLGKIIQNMKSFLCINDEKCRQERCDCLEVAYELIVGVALERRRVTGGDKGVKEDKVVKAGFMYSYPITIYKECFSGGVTQVKTVYILNCDTKDQRLDYVVRVGGRGRVARVYLENASPLSSISERLASPLKEALSEGYYVAVSPIPVIPKGANSTQLNLQDVYGLEVAKSESHLLGLLQECPRPPKLRVERLWLGFSESQGRRRPQVLALPSGSVIRITGDSGTAGASSAPGLLRVLWRAGYGTLLRVDVPSP